jgi:eukaryotic-like serine/threonine-protein kinase
VMPTASQLAQITRLGTAIGTLTYMSPEQVRGEDLDAPTDLFSFGAVLYEMVTGTIPFRGETAGAIANAILERVPVPPVRVNPDLPTKLEEIVTKALEKDRKLRYQNAADVCTDLQRLKRDSDRMAVEAAEAGVKPARESTRWAVTGATILVIGLAVGGWLFFSRKAHALTDKDTIVLALGVYFSAAAGSYAIGNLFPHLYMPFLRYLLPVFGVWLPSAWAYTFTKVPNDARLATATLLAGFPWLQR